MQKNHLAAILEDIGLSENQAKVYLAALSLGPSTVQKISQAAEIKRTTVYSVIDSLKSTGLMITQVKGFKNLFVAERPEKLKSILEARKEKFKKYLPEFSALYNLKESGSFLKYYEGLEAVKSIYKDLLREVKPHEDYLVISNSEPWFNLDPLYFQSYIERRAKLNIKIRLLLQDSKIAQEHKRLERNYNEKIKILPKGTSLSISMAIIPNKIMFHQTKPPILAIVVENQNIIQMHRELFEIIWNTISDN